MENQVKLLRRKIVGVLIRAAREKARWSVKEVAQRMGVTPARVRQWENGKREVAFPELETLALFLHAPLSFFLEGDQMINEPIPAPPTNEQLQARRIAIGERLKQARLALGKSRVECAAAIERKPGAISRYERGTSDIPITELDRLAQFLKVNLYYFLETARADDKGGELLDLEKLAHLPREVRAFVLEPGNLPFVRMAAKFGDLPADKLKELGEILLVVR